MRLKAIDDAGPGADVPVTIFSLGTKRKFMATPNDYPVSAVTAYPVRLLQCTANRTWCV